MSIIKTDLVTAFGAYYLEEGQNMDRLKSALRQPAVTPSFAKPIITESDIYRSSNTVLGEIVQQFQKAFTAKGDLNFKPNEIRLRNAKVDLAMYPDDVKASWLGFLASLTDAERANWPIVRYAIENEIVPQIQHDLETKAYFKGVYVAPTPGTPGTAAGVIDGVKKLLDDGITDTSMNEITLSTALSKTNIFDMVEEFVDGFDQALSGTKMRVYMSPSWVRAYFRDKRNTHGADINYNVNGINIIDFMPNVEIVGLPSMEGSNYIWATPTDNFVHVRKVNGMQDPKVEESKREVSFMLDWYEGIGFLHNELVYVSDGVVV
jgi:hypothetical protein